MEAGMGPDGLEMDPPGATQARAIVPPRHGGTQSIRVVPTDGHDVAIYDFDLRFPARPRLLVLKLDHLGDFIIGLPSLRRLREAFPDASIRLVVGSWNEAAAAASGLADEVATYDYFPQDTQGWDGTPDQPLDRFDAAAAGRFDAAIDLRVDEDTRFLLRRADAGMRCGIGSREHHPFLDVAMRPEYGARASVDVQDSGDALLGPDEFKSFLPFKSRFFHETDFRPLRGHAVYGPDLRLPAGRFRAIFALALTPWSFGLRKVSVTVDVCRNGSEIAALERLRGEQLRSLPADGVELGFTNDDPKALHEFRIHIEGRPLRAGLRFAGLRIERLGAPPAARFRRAELHVGEQLSLLVQLVADRTRQHYEAGPGLPAPVAGPARIVIAPLSNSDLRDWPPAQYAELGRLLLARLDCTITLVGSARQAPQLDRLAQAIGGGERVVDLGGRTAWADMPGLLRGADLVICNNSGIAHVAAAAGARTLALYSASHQPQEWGPRGRRSHAMMAVVPCSPCGHDRLSACPHEHSCMTGLTPRAVLTEALALLGAGLVRDG